MELDPVARTHDAVMVDGTGELWAAYLAGVGQPAMSVHEARCLAGLPARRDWLAPVEDADTTQAEDVHPEEWGHR
jgi:hypothetical protein